MGKTKDLGHLASMALYDASGNMTLPANLKINGSADVATQSYVGTQLGSYTPSTRSITINGTTYDLSADRSWTITSMIYPASGIALSTGSAWGTSITNNSANWNTAYGWGNHASAGYLTSINSSQVTTALGYTPYNSTNPNGYITSSGSISGSAASAGYLTGGDSNAYMLLYNSLSGDLNSYNTSGLYSAEYVGSTNRPVAQNGSFIQISDAGGNDVKTQWYYQSDGAGIYMRLQWGAGTWRNWRTLLTDANFTSYAVQSTSRSNWNSYSVISNVVGQLAWKNYGNSHTIFDASQGTSPDGTSVNNTNSNSAWTASYPTLMGWNGSSTYGVRVDSARVADSAGSASSASSASSLANNATARDIYNNGWFRNNNANEGVYSQPYGVHFYAYGSEGWTVTGSGGNIALQFRSNHQSTLRGYVYADTSNNIGFLDNGGNWSFRTNGGTVYSYAYRGKDNVAGTGEASYHPAGIYCPGTNWMYGTTYKNGTSTSGQGWMYLDWNYGHSVIGLYASTRYQGVWSMGGAYTLSEDGTSTGNLYGLAWSHPNTGGQAGYLSDHGLIHMMYGTAFVTLSSNIWCRNNITAYSDIRVKENIEVIENAMDKINAIRGVTFTRNDASDTKRRHAGVIAQEIQKVLPEVIEENASNGHLSVAYGNIVGLTIEGLKEHDKIIKQQAEEIKQLKDIINGLTK